MRSKDVVVQIRLERIARTQRVTTKTTHSWIVSLPTTHVSYSLRSKLLLLHLVLNLVLHLLPHPSAVSVDYTRHGVLMVVDLALGA